MKANIRIHKDNESLGLAATGIFVKSAMEAIEQRGRFLVALSGGSTPVTMYQYLAAPPYSLQVNWQKVFAFWGDERCVPPDVEGSNYRQAMDIFLSYVSIPDENLLRIKGELEPAEAIKDYIRILKKFASPPLDWPRFDLVLLGMGADGHTASLFPGSKIETSNPVRSARAEYQGRPAKRVTLTEPIINSARIVIFLVTGENKSQTLYQILKGMDEPEKLPAQRIQPTNGQLIWLIDEAAGSKL